MAREDLTSIGSRIVLSVSVDQVMIGTPDNGWDVAAIMYFLTRRSFVDVLLDREFQATWRHRKTALAADHQVHLDGGSS